jgi:predicted DNA-binding transcriptional regulator YafY
MLQQAIASKNLVTLFYLDSRQQSSMRKVEPIGLIFYAFSWHLIGWCHLRENYRDFKVERILKACNTGEPFTLQDHMPLDEYMKQLPVAY